MSLAKNASNKISEQAYLESELVSEIRHEYIDGYIYAMSGDTDNHNLIIGNVASEFRNQLKQRKSSCNTFSESVKVRENKTNTRFFYPDVFMICDKHKDDDAYYKHTPVIIVEVLSNATRKYDLTTKKLYYFNILTLQEYVVIEQDVCQITVFRKSNDWETELYFLGDTITFESVNITLLVEDVYYHVDNGEIIDYLKRTT